MKECKSCPYKTVEKIPTLIFLDRMMTVPATNSTFEFISHCLDYHEADLDWLWRKSQEYINIKGSQYRLDFNRWLKKARKGTTEYKQKGK